MIVVYGTAILTFATALLASITVGAIALLGGRPVRPVRTVVAIGLGSIPLHALVVVPATLGYLGSRLVGTRGDERAYRGPVFDADGTWRLQSRASLRAGPAPDSTPPARTVWLTAADGVPLRAFEVPAAEPNGLAAVLVHGLFRGAMELETPAAMLRRAGCHVLLLELRNHGGSGRAPCTFGVGEALDVRAACDHVRAAGLAPRGVLLYGISLGTIAVALAAPEVAGLRALVLDSPVPYLEATAHRMLAGGPPDQPRRLGLAQPFRSLSLWFLQRWSGVELASVRPLAALARLPRDRVRAALVIAAGGDDRIAIDEVRALHEALPAAARQLWQCAEAAHGGAFEAAAAEYEQRLREVVAQALR